MFKNRKVFFKEVDQKLALSFGALVLVLMLIVTGLTTFLYVQLQIKEENRLSGALAEILSESISKVSFSGKYQERLLVEEMKSRIPEIAYISVESSKGEILAHSDPEKNDSFIGEKDLEVTRRCILQNIRSVSEFRSGDKFLKKVILPYRGGLDSEIMGVINIGIDVGETRYQQWDYFLILFLLIIALTSVAIGIVFILSRHFGRTVREMAIQLKAILDNSPALIYMKDLNGRYLFINDRWAKLFHTTNDFIKGKTDQDFFPPEVASGFMKNDQLAIETGRMLEVEEQVSIGDELHTYQTIKVAIRDDLDQIYALCGISTDITARKYAEEEKEKLQKQLVHSQKMESVGLLAGGVAHDFNNMLTAILGYSELALLEIKPNQLLYKHLEEIKKAAQRSADLTGQLLAFARKQTIHPQILDLNKVVSSILNMLRRLISEDIVLDWKPKDGLWEVKMDPSQIDQILANLCVNSRDAIDSDGKVSIETDNVEFDEAYCRTQSGFFPGKYVMLAVSDNGRGMDKETLNHIFEPFFTTKVVGQGTGLGLATVYGIVRQNNGFINVYSELGIGTTLKLYFPYFSGEISVAEVTKEKAIIPQSQGETILLVEDEPFVLTLTQKMLRGLGYNVLVASTPGEALKLAEQHQLDLKLLITDVVMPEMNGRDLARRIQTIKPQLLCLYMSGYTANVIADQGVLNEGVNFIQKPYSLQNLALKVREVLEH